MVPKEAIPGRLGLLLTLFLCAVNTLNSTQRSTPKSGGTVTAIMQWIMACIGFIILAILEYAWILSHNKYMKSNKVSQNRKRAKQEAKSGDLSKRLDKLMLFIFPPVFFTFAIAFWTSKDQNWEFEHQFDNWLSKSFPHLCFFSECISISFVTVSKVLIL